MPEFNELPYIPTQTKWNRMNQQERLDWFNHFIDANPGPIFQKVMETLPSKKDQFTCFSMYNRAQRYQNQVLSTQLLAWQKKAVQLEAYNQLLEEKLAEVQRKLDGGKLN